MILNRRIQNNVPNLAPITTNFLCHTDKEGWANKTKTEGKVLSLLALMACICPGKVGWGVFLGHVLMALPFSDPQYDLSQI